MHFSRGKTELDALMARVYFSVSVWLLQNAVKHKAQTPPVAARGGAASMVVDEFIVED